MKNYILIFYMILLGLLSGSVLASGAFVAPVIFHANDYLQAPLLDRLTSGILMTQVFIKLNYLMLFISIFSAAYESYSFFGTKKGAISLTVSFLMLASVLIFVFYCTPFIVDAQKMGIAAVESAEFESVHKLSEALFKAILLCSLLLQGARLYALCRSNS